MTPLRATDAMTGILFVLVVIIGFAVTPQPPDADAAPAEVLNYVVDHHNALHAVQLIFAAAGLSLHLVHRHAARCPVPGRGRRRPPCSRQPGLGGGLIAVATLMVGFALAATATLHPVQSDPDLTRALWDASLMIPAVGAPAAARLLSRQRPQHPSLRRPSGLAWLARAGDGALQRAGHQRRIHRSRRVRRRWRARILRSASCLFLLWILLASITLVRRLGGAEPAHLTATLARGDAHAPDQEGPHVLERDRPARPLRGARGLGLCGKQDQRQADQAEVDPRQQDQALAR